MSRRTTVIFIWNVDESLEEYLSDKLENAKDLNLIFPSDTTQENLVKLAPKADIIVGWRPTKRLLLSAKKLRLFINPGAGVQHLIDLFREVTCFKSILLANCHGNSYFTAQHAVALLLTLTNKTVPHHTWMIRGEWRKQDEDARSVPLRDRRIGLLGYGAVNQKVHRFLSGFDLEFSILRRDWENQRLELHIPAKKYNFPKLHEFLEEINTLIIAVPLTSLTRDLIQMRELKLIGSEGLLVNVARGQVVNEEDLFTALKNEVIAGAAIDVWYNYKPEPDSDGRKYPFSHPFHELSNTVMSPHRAASPFDDLRRWDEVIENIEIFAKGSKNFINIVDLEQEY